MGIDVQCVRDEHVQGKVGGGGGLGLTAGRTHVSQGMFSSQHL